MHLQFSTSDPSIHSSIYPSILRDPQCHPYPPINSTDEPNHKYRTQTRLQLCRTYLTSLVRNPPPRPLTVFARPITPTRRFA